MQLSEIALISKRFDVGVVMKVVFLCMTKLQLQIILTPYKSLPFQIFPANYYCIETFR